MARTFALHVLVSDVLETRTRYWTGETHGAKEIYLGPS
jgi:hypothetical protein